MITDNELQEWRRAQDLAVRAMGRKTPKRGRKTEWVATDDPLAWWTLTEAIMGFYFRGRDAMTRFPHPQLLQDYGVMSHE